MSGPHTDVLPTSALTITVLTVMVLVAGILAVRRQRWVVRDERGSVTLEAVIVYPVVLLLIFTVIQGAFWFHGRDAARHAATVGAATAAAQGSTNDTGSEAAASFLDQAESLEDVNIAVTRSGAAVAVTVQGTTLSLIPGVSWPSVSQQATQAIERVTGP